MSLYLGIDTSNYTTSAAVADENGIVKSEKQLLAVKPGERGLRQSDAVFSHVINLPEVISRLGKCDFKAIGVSSKPRDAEGSYMPCFMAGVAVAESLGSLLGVPVYRFSHQTGHIVAASYSAGILDRLKERFIAFHISGGTTEILLCDGLKTENIGGTLDLNAGQAIDRAGVLLGLGFPCGPELEKLARDGILPEKPKICVNGFDCNLSGLENKVQGLIKQGAKKQDIALYVLEFVKNTLDELSGNLREKYDLPIVYAGGVMSNGLIRRKLSERKETYFAESRFSCDNAAGTALLAMMKGRGIID